MKLIKIMLFVAVIGLIFTPDSVNADDGQKFFLAHDGSNVAGTLGRDVVFHFAFVDESTGCDFRCDQADS